MRTVASQYRAAIGFGLATWLLAFGVGPFLHLVQHEDDHVHLPDGGIRYVARVAPLGDGPRTPAPPPPTGPTGPSDPEAPEHGSGGLAHFGAASVASPAAPARPGPPGPAASAVDAPAVQEPPRPRWATPRPSRDPPAHA